MGGIRKAVADADCPEAVVEAKRPRRTADGPVLAVDVGNSVTNLGLFEGGGAGCDMDCDYLRTPHDR